MNSSSTTSQNDMSVSDWTEIQDLIRCPYTSACVNRRPGCSHVTLLDLHNKIYGDLLAFGANNAICIARTIETNQLDCVDGFRVLRLLLGHNSPVTCLRWISNVSKDHSEQYFFLASADNTGAIKIWACKKDSILADLWCSAGGDWFLMLELSLPNQFSANAVDGFISNSFDTKTSDTTGVLTLDVAADTSIYTWHIGLHTDTGEVNHCVLAHRATKRSPSMCLCLRSCLWMNQSAAPIHFVFVGLDNGKTEINSEYIIGIQGDTSEQLTCSAVLPGHTDWIRCLDIKQDSIEHTTSLYLATGSQDNVIRLWHIFPNTQVDDVPTYSSGGKICDLKLPTRSKPLEFGLSVASESVLSGHDNWITGVAWSPKDTLFPPRLLSSSMDKSLIIWSPPQNGNAQIWLESARLGNLGGTDMGFLDGFWLSSDTNTIFGHHFQGSLSVWHFSADKSFWSPGLPVCGHSGPVTDLAWSRQKVTNACLTEQNRCVIPTYLLTVSSDQTVRVHAPRKVAITSGCQENGKGAKEGWIWHELARPQVHGYDMNAICSLSTIGYVSAGDEKVVRVFNATRPFVDAYRKATGIESYMLADECTLSQLTLTLAEGAVQPTLGLSNQMISSEASTVRCNGTEPDATLPTEQGDTLLSTNSFTFPTEDRLQHATLWPEAKKLYGHPYEVYSLAAHPCYPLVASACVASKQTHAYIILWNGMADWSIHQRLAHHQLTVTQLTWSFDGRHLLAVSRDRTWSVWSCSGTPNTDSPPPTYSLTAYPQKGSGHSRIIWTCAWSPDNTYFVSGSRDKTLLVWPTPDVSKSVESAPKAYRPLIAPKLLHEAVTAVDICQLTDPDTSSNRQPHLVAVGLETGALLLLTLFRNGAAEVPGCTPLEWSVSMRIPPFWSHVPGKHIKRVAFEPSSKLTSGTADSNSIFLASGADDGVVHIFEIDAKLLLVRLSAIASHCS